MANNDYKHVRAAVPKTGPINALLCARLYKNAQGEPRIQGRNAIYAIDAPFDHDLDVTVNADRFFIAYGDGEGVALRATDKNLIVTRGKLRAQIPLESNPHYPLEQPDGITRDVMPGLKDNLLRAAQFAAGKNEIRQQLQAVFLASGNVYATNGMIAIRIKQAGIPEVTAGLPVDAVKALGKFKGDIVKARVSDHSVTFKIGETWIKAQTVSGSMPDIDRIIPEQECDTIPEGLYDVLKALEPFAIGPYPIIYLTDAGLVIRDQEGVEVASDASIKLPEACYRLDMLEAVVLNATAMHFEGFPRACRFEAPGLDGAIIGVRLA